MTAEYHPAGIVGMASIEGFGFLERPLLGTDHPLPHLDQGRSQVLHQGWSLDTGDFAYVAPRVIRLCGNVERCVRKAFTKLPQHHKSHIQGGVLGM